VDGLPFSPAAERNRQPILDRLLALLPPRGRALEIASGSGQHATAFAAALPGWTWQPTDFEADLCPLIDERARRAGLHNVQPARRLDVLQTPWPSEGPVFTEAFDLIYCANLLHIAPWRCSEALFQGAATHLAPTGCLITYGPYLEDDVPTSEGNRQFDASLRSSNPAWGIRRLEDVTRTAADAGLHRALRQPMPANNLLLVWRRSDGT
jgi:SAM-dependent methyltransferase